MTPHDHDRPEEHKDNRPTAEDLSAVVQQMAMLIPFFPKDEVSQAQLGVILDNMVGTADELRWLAYTAINVITRFEGVPQLRALFCSRFTPRDGIVIHARVRRDDATMAGFTAEDIESEFHQRESQRAHLAIEGWKQERRQRLLSGEVEEPLPPIPIHLERPLPRAAWVDPETDAATIEAERRLRGVLGIPEPPRKSTAELEAELKTTRRPARSAGELAAEVDQLRAELRMRFGVELP